MGRCVQRKTAVGRIEQPLPQPLETKRAAKLQLPDPPRVDELPRAHTLTPAELAARHPLATAAILIGGGGALLAGGAPLMHLETQAVAPAQGTAEQGKQFLDRANGPNVDRRELYRAYANGGSAAIGAQPATPIERAGGVTEYPPTAKANGLRVYFLYGFGASTFDQAMASVHRATIDDDIAAARAKGYTVIVDRAATREDVARTMYDPTAAGVVWVGHGAAGGYLTTSDGGFVRSADLDAGRVGKHLRFVVLQACHSDEDAGWKQIFGGAKVISFHGKTRWGDVLDFNRPNSSIGDYFAGHPIELDDLIRDRL